MGFLTDAVHAGQVPDPYSGAVITPIYQTSTYVQEELGTDSGFDYGRTVNPTRTALESNIAVLEGGKYGFAFSSGMAAISAVMGLLKPGDHVVVTRNVYGGTYRYFDMVLRDYGIEFGYVDTSDVDLVSAAVKKKTRMLYVETPTNPMLIISDLKALSQIAKKANLIHVVDNTFLSPYYQRPLEFGVDIVIHSTTKYINGHSDVIGGVVVTNTASYAERIKFLQNSEGAVPGPFDCWLVLRGVKTLPLRMRQHNYNAFEIANFLIGHPAIKKVYYPGLPSHPQHQLARRQQIDPYGDPGFGGMISIELGSIEKARNFLKNLEIFSLAESLGGIESLVCHPVTMTHGSVPPEERLELGITEGLVRLSVGIEDFEDLRNDLERALSAI